MCCTDGMQAGLTLAGARSGVSSEQSLVDMQSTGEQSLGMPELCMLDACHVKSCMQQI